MAPTPLLITPQPINGFYDPIDQNATGAVTIELDPTETAEVTITPIQSGVWGAWNYLNGTPYDTGATAGVTGYVTGVADDTSAGNAPTKVTLVVHGQSNNIIMPNWASGWTSVATNTSVVYSSTTTIYVNGVPLNGIATYGSNYIPQLSKQETLKNRIAKNLRPSIEAKNGSLMALNRDPAERRARRLLSDLISREEFKRYLVRGFIMVKGRSGILYKIAGGHQQIISYVKNAEGRYEPFESFCVVFQDSRLPWTDGVIMRKLLIDTEEFKLHQIANVFKIRKAA